MALDFKTALNNEWKVGGPRAACRLFLDAINSTIDTKQTSDHEKAGVVEPINNQFFEKIRSVWPEPPNMLLKPEDYATYNALKGAVEASERIEDDLETVPYLSGAMLVFLGVGVAAAALALLFGAWPVVTGIIAGASLLVGGALYGIKERVIRRKHQSYPLLAADLCEQGLSKGAL